MTNCRCCEGVVFSDEVLWCLEGPPGIDHGQQAGGAAVLPRVYQRPVAGAVPYCPQCAAGVRECCVEVRPAPAILETCWRLRGPSGKIVECGIYCLDDASRFEVRAGYDADDPINSKLEPTLHRARGRAAVWKDALLAKGGFEELSLTVEL